MALSSNAEQVRTEEVPCPWCGETECRPLFSTEDLMSGEGEFVVARCPECGLIYTRVRPRPEDLGHFYPSTYYTGMAAPRRATSSNWQSRFPREASLRVIFGYPCGGLVSTPSRVMSLMAPWVMWGLRRDAPASLDGGGSLAGSGCLAVAASFKPMSSLAGMEWAWRSAILRPAWPGRQDWT